MSDETVVQPTTEAAPAPAADAATDAAPATPDLLSGDTAQPQAQEAQEAQSPDLLGTGQQYSFEQPRGVQMEQQAHDQLSGFAGQLARAAGVTDNAQAQKLYEAIAQQTQEHQNQMQQGMAAAQEENDTALEREVGATEAQALRGQANSYLHQNGGENLARVLSENGLGRHPEVIKFLASRASAPEPQMGAASSKVPQTLAEAMQGDEDAWQAFLSSKKKQ